ncbi:hypothetical protein PPL19_09511 [Pseudomonas psychrotolerans L19]|uniref:hypothetical protein n=1 Tax=Pseudomonas TaxID=286 RepID=UPI00023A47BD|nr:MULTISPECIES: hypothetical protein [Pseudomonas]EHK71910.1 hypothetical protein PPL19_09511 [Pseudomonas psychrotolerans L19]TCQ87047.1 hypothetical protein EC839_10718 [Pseudomonas sp. JUb52]
MRTSSLLSALLLGLSLSGAALAQTSPTNPPATPARPDPTSTHGLEKAPSTGVGAADNGSSSGSGSDTGTDHVKKPRSQHKDH